MYAAVDATTVGDGDAAADDVDKDGNGGFSNESEQSVTAAGLSVRPRVSSSWQDTMSVRSRDYGRRGLSSGSQHASLGI